MAKSDAEISLKVNMPPPSDFQKMLERANRIIADNKKQLEEYRKTVAEVAEGARIMEQRARATGSAEMVKTARAQFTEGWKVASTLDTREERLSQGLGTMEGRVGAVAAAKDAGKITDEEAVALLAKYTAELEKANEAVTELGYSLEVTKGDLITAEAFDEMLGRFEAFRMTMSDTGQAARDFAAEMRAQADAYAEEREALNASMPGYEQQAAKLMQLEREYRGLASAAEAVTGTLAGSQAKVKEALDAYDGSAEAQKKVYEAIDAGSKKALEADTKLQGIAEKRAMSEQKRAADEEKAREREAAAAKKRAEQEEERARKEEELRVERERKEAEAAAKREAREAEMAARDAERFEREQFQMKISALSKQELIKVLDDLRKAREAASKADDAETYAKRTREFNMAREQMERTNAALNVQKMMYMQQATAVKSMAQNIEELGEKVANVGEDAEEGELDLVGMAEGAGELVNQFQAGIGPMGAFLAVLQAIQNGYNQWNKLNKELNELDEAREDRLQAVLTSYQQVIAVMEQANEQKMLEEKVKEIKARYADLNAEIANSRELAAQTLEVENKRRSLLEEEIAFKQKMYKEELELSLLQGKITREEYYMAMIERDEEVAVNRAQRDANAAKNKAQEARATAELAHDKLIDAQWEDKPEWYDDWETFYEKGPGLEELAEIERTQKERWAEYGAAMKEYKEEAAKYNDAFERFGMNPLDWVGRGAGEIGALIAGVDGISELERKKLKKKLRRVTDAKLAAQQYDEISRARTGGRSVQDYRKGYTRSKTVKEEYDANMAELEKTEADAWAAYEAAKAEAEEANERAKRMRERADETVRIKKAQQETKTAVDKETKALEDKLGELRNKLDEMTDEEIEDLLAKSKKGAKKYGKNTPKGIYYRNRAEALREERSQRKRDRKAPGYIEWLTGEGQRAFADGSAQGNTAQVKQLLDIYEKAKKTTTKKDDELAKALIRLINLETVQNKKLRAKLKAVQENLMQ